MTQNHIHSVCPLLIELPPVSGLTGQMLTHVASHSRGQVELNKGISLGWVPHLSVCPARISPSTLPGFPPPPPCVDMTVWTNMSAQEAKVTQITALVGKPRVQSLCPLHFLPLVLVNVHAKFGAACQSLVQLLIQGEEKALDTKEKVQSMVFHWATLIRAVRGSGLQKFLSFW